VPPKPLPFETLHGGSAIRFLGSVYATAQNIFISSSWRLHHVRMTREAGQGSGSSERMGGYDQFSSLLFYVLEIIYVSYVHLCCFVCSHRIISSVLSYYNMLYLLVLILVMLFMLLSDYFQLFQHNTCTMLICVLYLYDSYALCSHDPYCYGYI
jgi:magnesium-transporting ATPase (P-type)